VPTRWLFFVGAAIASLYGALAMIVAARVALRDFGRRGVAGDVAGRALRAGGHGGAGAGAGQPMEMRGTLLGPLP
jgi:hypothetical protein